MPFSQVRKSVRHVTRRRCSGAIVSWSGGPDTTAHTRQILVGGAFAGALAHPSREDGSIGLLHSCGTRRSLLSWSR